MKAYLSKYILLSLLIVSSSLNGWVNVGGSRYVDLDIDPNFHLLYGGPGTFLHGDFAATGNSILRSNNPTNANLINDTTTYKLDDTDFNIHTDPEKRNSASATLALPSYVQASDIVWAGLFWQGQVFRPNSGHNQTNADADAAGWDTVSLKTPDGTMHSFTAPAGSNNSTHKSYHHAETDGNGYRYFFSGYHDVTSEIQSTYSPTSNNYTVGHIKTTAGNDNGEFVYINNAQDPNAISQTFRFGLYGGWSLIVVYSLPQDVIVANDIPLKNVSIYDGYDLFLTWGNGRVPFETTIDIDGFMTPKEGTVNSKLLFFGGAGDRGIADDTLAIRDRKNTTFNVLSNTPNNPGLQFNHTYTNLGVHMTPGDANKQGMDLDIYDISASLDNSQTETQIKFGVVKDNNKCDQVFPQVIGISTELYEPKFCYDYAYKQQGKYFTEDNNGLEPPKLSTNKIPTGLIPGEPIEVSIYVRNEVDSDVVVSNLKVNVLDINTSLASYISETTQRNLVNQVNPEPIADSLLNVSDSYIRNIPIGTLGSLEYFYIYYKLNPLSLELNTPIDIELEYDITIDGNTIPYTSKLGVGGIGMCTDSNFNYTPQYGVFNIVHNSYYNADMSGSDAFYNLPTQVVKREGNFKVISLDEVNQDDLNPVSTIVGVELIDAAAFHDTEASCKEPTSSISERIWINIDSNSTSAPFDRNAIQNAIGLNNTMTSSASFYQNARENAAFRITYIVSGNGNNALVKTQEQNGEYRILNFSEVVQTVGACTQDVKYPLNANQTGIATQVSQACGNSGNFISRAHLQACMECIYGQNTKSVCSRDNFAIRPEAFLMQLDDQNQTNPSLQTDITALAHSGSAGATAPALLNLAAGYQYNIEVNATSHIDNISSLGYTKTFNLAGPDSANYTWEPIGAPTCNDAVNKNINQAPSIALYDGSLDTNTSVSQTGQYRLSINDTTWTTVDSNPIFMLHHTGPHFQTTLDCVPGSTNVQPVNDLTILNGCNISSNHTNAEANLKYNDYNVFFHPYKFGVTNTITLGLANVAPSPQAYIYMADISQDENMSVHLNTMVTAQGHDSNFLNNFTDQCYSQPVELTIGKTLTQYPLLQYKYRVHNRDINDATISAHDINQTIASGDLTTVPSFTAAATFFQQDQNGTIDLMTNLNYHRDINTSVNPEDINITTITAIDNTTLFSADLKNDAFAEGNVSVDQRVLHYYGRTNAPRQRFTTPTGTATSPAQAFIYYEVHCDVANGCDKSLLQGGVNANTTNDPRWFINTSHIPLNDGLVDTDGTISQKNSPTPPAVTHNPITTTINGVTTIPLIYDGSRNYPYKATMENNSSNWLLYNKYNPTATANEFEVEFDSANSNWAGVRETTTSTNAESAPKTNRRVMW